MEIEEFEEDEMWCGHEWHHYGHYWTDHYGVEWYCDSY
jgi:hypothetical protein